MSLWALWAVFFPVLFQMKDLRTKGENCPQDQAVGPLLGEGSEVWVCSEERNLKWGQASSVNVEEVTRGQLCPDSSRSCPPFLPGSPPVPFPLCPSFFLGMHRSIFLELTPGPQPSPPWCPSVKIFVDAFCFLPRHTIYRLQCLGHGLGFCGENQFHRCQ